MPQELFHFIDIYVAVYVLQLIQAVPGAGASAA